jgi:hypothetical protein
MKMFWKLGLVFFKKDNRNKWRCEQICIRKKKENRKNEDAQRKQMETKNDNVKRKR